MSIGPDLVIYGGTFDPPHQGHVDCLREAMKRFPKAQYWVLPGAQPAVAGGGGKRSVASFKDRMEMARLAFESMGASPVTVKPVELDLPRPNYTWVTLSHIADIQPGHRLGLLLGQDQMRAFAGWKNPRRILDMADVIAVRRRRTAEDSEMNVNSLKETVEGVIQELELTPTWHEAGVVSFEEVTGRLFMMDSLISPAESSDIRDRINAGINAPEAWIPAPVLEYMKEANLYSPGLFPDRI